MGLFTGSKESEYPDGEGGFFLHTTSFFRGQSSEAGKYPQSEHDSVIHHKADGTATEVGHSFWH